MTASASFSHDVGKQTIYTKRATAGITYGEIISRDHEHLFSCLLSATEIFFYNFLRYAAALMLEKKIKKCSEKLSVLEVV
jgi:hypothetical protein